MFGISRRDVWAFFIGQASVGLMLGLLLHIPNLFLLNGLLLIFDTYFYMNARDKDAKDN